VPSGGLYECRLRQRAFEWNEPTSGEVAEVDRLQSGSGRSRLGFHEAAPWIDAWSIHPYRDVYSSSLS
jgi:hypothetical protein